MDGDQIDGDQIDGDRGHRRILPLRPGERGVHPARGACRFLTGATAANAAEPGDSWRRIYDEHLVHGFLGAVPGLRARLAAGAAVLDLGCGTGHAVTLAARPRFDVITAFDAVHDQRSPQEVLRQVRAALAPGGAGLGAMWGTGLARQMLSPAGFGQVAALDSPRPQNCIFVCRP